MLLDVLCSSTAEDELGRIAASARADGYVRKDTLIAREILELLDWLDCPRPGHLEHGHPCARLHGRSPDM